MKFFSRAKRRRGLRNAFNLGRIDGYLKCRDEDAGSVPYEDTLNHELDQRELLLMLEDERLDQRLGDTPEWTLS